MVSLFVIHLASLFGSVFNWIQANLSHSLHVLLFYTHSSFFGTFLLFSTYLQSIAFSKSNVGFLETLSFNFSQTYQSYFM